MQEGDDRDPFAEAEERERRRSQDAKRRHTAMHQPAQAATQVGNHYTDGGKHTESSLLQLMLHVGDIDWQCSMNMC